MESDSGYSAIIGLFGVLIGSAITVVSQWLLERKKSSKAGEYLAVVVSGALEEFADKCIEVLDDDGLSYGQRDELGCLSSQVNPPRFSPEKHNVDWKSIHSPLLNDLFDFSRKCAAADRRIAYVYEYVADRPDYEDFFEARRDEYGSLGLEAVELSRRLRIHAKLRERSEAEFGLVETLRAKIDSAKISKEARLDRGRLLSEATLPSLQSPAET